MRTSKDWVTSCIRGVRCTQHTSPTGRKQSLYCVRYPSGRLIATGGTAADAWERAHTQIRVWTKTRNAYGAERDFYRPEFTRYETALHRAIGEAAAASDRDPTAHDLYVDLLRVAHARGLTSTSSQE